MDSVRMGVVGLGRRGYALLETILECEEAAVTAVCDVYEDRREEAKKYITEKRGTAPRLYENYKDLLSESLARAGKFGEIVNCHGAYAHDLRDQILGGYVNRHYRLENYRLRNCENHPTHELGPIAKILNINRGNQLLSLVSVASKAA